MATRSVAEDIFEQYPVVHLIGGRHRGTGKFVFPLPTGGDALEYERVGLSPVGRLWSWTIQRFRPKSPPYIGPEEFEPFAVGYIELPGELIVEARLVNVEFGLLEIGTPYRATTAPFAYDADGTIVRTYAFEPAEGPGA